MTLTFDRWRLWIGSLKFRITVGTIAALLVGIGLVTLLLIGHAERDTLDAQREQELDRAVHTAALLSRRVVDLQRALQAAATRLEPSALEDERRLGAFLESQPGLLNAFANVFVATPDGQVALMMDAAGLRKPQVRIADRDYFVRTLREGRPIVSEPVPGRISSEPVIVLTYPLRRDGAVAGVIGGVLRLASRDLLGDLIDAASGEGARLIVVTDAQGRVIAHPVRSRLLQPLTADPQLAGAFADWQSRGAPVEPAGLPLRERDAVAAAAGVAGPDWVVWHRLPEGEVLAPLHAARREALRWMLMLALGLSAAALALLHRQLAPLAQLERRALHLFDGRHDPHEGWPENGSEIGRLARVLRHVGAERAQLEAFNAQVLQKLESVMSAAPVGIAFTRNQRFELVSDEFCKLLGRTESDLLGQPAQIIYASNEDYLALGPRVREAFVAGQCYVGEWQMLRASGQRFWAQLRGRPVDPQDTQAGTIWTVSDVTEHVAAREQLEWSAHHDVLTGLANRKAFETRLAQVFNARPRSLPAELVMIDLDHFKPINDKAGHAAGDAMLKRVAEAITGCIRTTDLAARIGGDEFALILERCHHDAALRIAANVQQAITAIGLAWEGHVLGVGASLGVATLAGDTGSTGAWVEAADAACYAAKSGGRNAVRAARRSAREAEAVAG